MTKSVEFECIYSDVVNFAMQQNYVPVIKKITVKNFLEEDMKELELVISTEPEFAREWKTTLALVPAGQIIELDVVDLKLSPDFLAKLTEKIAGMLYIDIKQDQAVIHSFAGKITVLAYDEWSGTAVLPEITAAFVTPNHPAIAKVLHNAGTILRKWTGSPSFTAYQSNNPTNVKMQMAAIYTALQQEEINYCLPPASYELTGQRLRLCDTVLTQKIGTCLDLSLLYVGCLEAAGLNPILIFLKNHAFAGCWLDDECFAECLQDDSSLLTKRTAEGIHEICLVECTCLTAGYNIPFDDAVKAGENNLTDRQQFELFIDIKRTRGSGIRPIPQRINTEGGLILEEGHQSSPNSDHGESMLAPSELNVVATIDNAEHIKVTRRQIWERKLLDLSLRNTLVSFRVTKNTIQIIAGKLAKLEDALAGGQEFQILAKPKDWENTPRDSKIYALDQQSSALDNLVQSEFANKRLRTFLEEDEVTLRITNLYRQAKLSLEENGSNTLFLALGFLKWYESDVSEKERYAPLVLLPVEIIRKTAKKGYLIHLRDEDPQMNITLLEMLRQDFGLQISGLDPLPIDESGIDLKRVFNIMRRAVMAKSRWDVEELAFIGLFSFSQFIMWNDIRNRAEDLTKNKIVASLMSGRLEWEPVSDFPAPESLDTTFTPVDFAIPLSADSSQLSAICASGQGNSFVLHGPPGTGKSQTITNIIANALFQGKSVLFIAEKMAALSVVQKRLSAIGLGPFCLELHSNKAKKKDVLAQLQQVMELGKLQVPEEYEEKANRLHELRLQLNEVVEAVHRKRHFGFSLYEALVRYEQYQNMPEQIIITAEQVTALSTQTYTHWTDLVSELKTAGTACGGAYRNPLREFTISDYRQNTKQEIVQDLSPYQEALQAMQAAVSSLSAVLGFQPVRPVRTYWQVRAFVELLKLLVEAKIFPAKLIGCQDLPEFKTTVDHVCTCGQKRDALEKQLRQNFSESILSFDQETARQQWNLAAAGWFLPKYLGQNKVVKTLKMHASNPAQFKKEQVIPTLNLITEYKSMAKIVEESSPQFSELFGLLWKQGRADWDTLTTVCAQAIKTRELLAEISRVTADCGSDPAEQQTLEIYLAKAAGDLFQFQMKNQELLHTAISEFEKLESLEQSLSQKAGIDFATIHSTDDDWLDLMQNKARTWVQHLDSLRNWCTFLNVKAKVLEAGLASIVTAYEQGLVTTENLLPAFYRAVSLACATFVLDREACLSAFNGALFEEKIARYKQTCAEFEQLTRQELVARLSAKIPSPYGNYANSSEIGILQKAVRSNGRMLSIRRLFDQIPNLLRKICPCMLMSPISVAQYIDPQFPPFDLIIFDEASQLPTCEAVGAIARGKNLIVVGDPKQLPPTNFFNTNRFDEDNYEKEDLESVLDDCLALSMPEEHLLWHYRSRHESLIAFSNRQYYDNKLFAFPSPNDLVSEVEYIPVTGHYDRGSSKQNKAEAQAVVAEIIRRWQDPVLNKQSIGVVTFSSVQQNLIDDLLAEAIAANPELEEINNQATEPIFIKNLENVQGDERDVILFSIGYGPDSDGKITLNFGPLNRDGGWRRLNVAVSRARYKMMIFATLQPEHIDLTKTRSEGVAGLKAFLTFAQKGKSALPVKSADAGQENGALEKLIAQKLRLYGFEVHTHIGSSEYKIDIGIVHPLKKDEYILAILCDGQNYVNAKTARDRNILQESVLKSLGWNIYRLWILDWWENPGKELEKIQKAVEKALDEKDLKKEVPEIETMKNPQPLRYASEKIANSVKLEEMNNKPQAINRSVDPVESDENLQAYISCGLESINGSAEDFCQPQHNRLILSQIEQVLAAEAPISKNLLGKRVLSAWGIARMGARLERRMEELITAGRFKKTKSHQAVFYWNKEQQPENYELFRIPNGDGLRRDMEDIPAEEIANAVKHILTNQISLSKEDLVKEVYKLFGFARGSAAMEEIIRAGIKMGVKRGYVAVDDGGRIVVRE